MKLSILICSVPRRLRMAVDLWAELLAQAEGKDVEILMLTDNKKRTIGAKRQALLDLAQGEYVAYVDDDDIVSNYYVDLLLAAVEDSKPDVVNFPIRVTLDGEKEGIVKSSIHNPIQEYIPGGVTLRKPIQLSAWRRSIAKEAGFPDQNVAEDSRFRDRACALARTERNLDSQLYHYRFRSDLGECPK